MRCTTRSHAYDLLLTRVSPMRCGVPYQRFHCSLLTSWKVREVRLKTWKQGMAHLGNYAMNEGEG